MSEVGFSPLMSGEEKDFLSKLNLEKDKALAIHQELERLTLAFVKKKLRLMFGSYQSDDALDIVNQTFLIVYNHHSNKKELDFTNPPSSLKSYFWRIAHYLCNDYHRKKIKSKFESLSEEDDERGKKEKLVVYENPENLFINDETNKIIEECQKEALYNLKENNSEDYSILIKYYLDYGKTPQEMRLFRDQMAEELGVKRIYLPVLINRIKEVVNNNCRKCLRSKGLLNYNVF